MNEVLQFLKDNWKEISEVIAYIIALASIIVRLTPTVSDDNILLPIIKFISKYLAINTPTPEKRPS